MVVVKMRIVCAGRGDVCGEQRKRRAQTPPARAEFDRLGRAEEGEVRSRTLVLGMSS
jgi:hypothetical protein